MEESTVYIILILGIASGVTIYLGETHRVHWQHAGYVWSAVSCVLGSAFGVKALYYHGDPHLAYVPSAIKEWILPIGVPALFAIGIGAGLGWLAAHVMPFVQSKF